MKYYALYDDDGKLLTFGMTSAKTVKGEITEAEYQALEQMRQEMYGYAERVYAGDITIDDIPEEYREDVATMIEDMQAAEPDPDEISDAEALAIIQGVVE